MDYSKSSNTNKKRSAASKTKKAKNRMVIVAFRAVVSVILIGVFATGGIVFGAYMGILSQVSHLVGNMAYAPVGESSIVFDRFGNEMGRFVNTNREMVDIEDIPLHLQNAFIAIEDQRFFEHNGVDIRGTIRAVYVNLTTDRSEGGSTITQQLIKNNVMGLHHGNTVETKLQEQFLALHLTQELTELHGREGAKMRILEQYLNTVYLANGLHGVQAAARFYFGKEVSELTLSESAVIAGITQLPGHWNPVVNPDNNRQRQITILNRMLAQGMITEAEHRYAYNDPVFDRISTFRTEQGGRQFQGYFMDHLFDVLVQELIENGLAFSPFDAQALIFDGGLRIHTTMDPRIQNIMEEAAMNDALFPAQFEIHIYYRLSMNNTLTNEITHHNFIGENVGVVATADLVDEWVENMRAELLGEHVEIIQETIIATPQPQSAMVVIDHHTGQVHGLVGGRGEVQTNRGLNRATDTTRQPGSVFKMVAAYAPAFDLGLVGPGSVRVDEPVTFTLPGGQTWSPTNFNSTQFQGRMPLRRAIAISTNTIAAGIVVEEVGVERMFDYLLNFGFTTLVGDTVAGSTDRVPSAALGGLTHGVTQLEITAAFAAMANNGLYIEPTVFTRVYNHQGELLMQPTPEVRQVITPSTAYMLTSTMRDVVTNGTGGRAHLDNGMIVAGKTGTSQWTNDINFVGYTPHFTGGIWMGFDQPQTLRSHGSAHVSKWAYVMNRINSELELPIVTRFERPDTIVEVQISVDSGLLARPGVSDRIAGGSRVRTDIFDINHVPTEFCPFHRELRIDTATGQEWTGDTPWYRQEVVAVVYDPETNQASEESTDYLRDHYTQQNPDEPVDEWDEMQPLDPWPPAQETWPPVIEDLVPWEPEELPPVVIPEPIELPVIPEFSEQQFGGGN